jgi:hypothetical protein
VRYVVTTSPGLVVTIRDGRLDLTEADETAFTFDAIQSRLSASRKALEIDLTSRSNLWDTLSFSASLSADDLKSEGSIRLTRFRPTSLPPDSQNESLADRSSDADLSVKFSAVGR